jgi:hypothetical protein
MPEAGKQLSHTCKVPVSFFSLLLLSPRRTSILPFKANRHRVQTDFLSTPTVSRAPSYPFLLPPRTFNDLQPTGSLKLP